MGVAFPIGLRLWADSGALDRGTLARRIGQFYSLNVAGAILGSLAAGFVLLPAIGSYRSLTILAAMSFAAGVVLLAVAEWRGRARLLAAAGGAIAFAAAIAGSPDPFDEFVAQRYRHDRIVWKEEGVESTAVVHESPRRDRFSPSTATTRRAPTGAPRMSTAASAIFRWRCIHGRTPALVIGLGGGATAGAVSVHGADVDIVELAGSVVRGARFFDAINYGVLARPNAHLRVDDGRNFLTLTPRRYDVITAISSIRSSSDRETSIPSTISAAAARPQARRMAVQWVAGTDAEYKIIARRSSLFPQTTVWGGESLLVGMTEPLHLARSDFDWKLGVARTRAGTARSGPPTSTRCSARSRPGPDRLAAFVGSGPLLTDDRPSVQ